MPNFPAFETQRAGLSAKDLSAKRLHRGRSILIGVLAMRGRLLGGHQVIAARVNFDPISKDYRAARGLPAETLALWRDALTPFLSPATTPRVLDLGSGTGRFSELLSSLCRWVVAVEPSSGMRAEAAKQGSTAEIYQVAGLGEALPFFDRMFDVAWLSHVWHHISDRPTCAKELRRVLRSKGCVLIRGVFADRVGQCTYFEYFPGSRRIIEQGFPRLEETIEVFSAAGFACEGVKTLVQQTCSNLRELADRTRLRADSTLKLLPDEEFDRCQRKLERATLRQKSQNPVIETLELAAFRRR